MKIRVGIVIASLLLCARGVQADEVVLGSGLKLEGTIVSETDDQLVLKLKGGGRTTLQKKMIRSVKREALPKPAKKAPEKTPERTPRKPTKKAPRSPDLGPGQALSKNVQLFTRTLDDPLETEVWIYKTAKQGRRPLVLIAPAGATLLDGMKLDLEDRKEHTPYAERGFHVVAYAPSSMRKENSWPGALDAFPGFRKAKAGVLNGRAALEFALRNLDVDKRRIYAVGHSSAGTLALQLTMFDRRITACVAFAPAVDLERRLTKPRIKLFSKRYPELPEFVSKYSPHLHPSKIRVPLLLYHATDDDVVPHEPTEAYAAQVRKHNPRVTLLLPDSGGHFDGMFANGIPRAIKWLEAVGRR